MTHDLVWAGMMASQRSCDHYHRFEWDRTTGYSHDIILYGPFDCSSCSWIIPGTIEENEYDIELEPRPVSVLHHFRQPGGER